VRIIIDLPVGWRFDYLTSVRQLAQPERFRLCVLSKKTGHPIFGEGASIPEAVAAAQQNMAAWNEVEKRYDRPNGQRADDTLRQMRVESAASD
jgi:hypothetical protein